LPANTPRAIAAGTQIAAAATIANTVARMGKTNNELSFFRTYQLCFVKAQPREILPITAPWSVGGRVAL
jgi:hypothetical protein